MDLSSSTNSLKSEQKNVNKSLLDKLPDNLSEVDLSHEIQSRAAEVNFDWHNSFEVIEVLKGEILELEEAVINSDMAHSEEEFGDILFTCVNLARHLKTSVEKSLHQANEKFSQRFKVVEQLLAKENKIILPEEFDACLMENTPEQKCSIM